MRQIIPYALCCGWSLIFGMAFALYFARIKNMPFYCLLPADYHTYDTEQLKRFWNQDEAWRRHKTARAIMVAPLVYIAGVILAMFLGAIRVTPAAAAVPTVTPEATSTPTVYITQAPTATVGPTATLDIIYLDVIQQDGSTTFVEATAQP